MRVSFNLKFYVGDEIFCSEINVNVLAEFTFAKLLEALHALAPNEELVGLKWIDAVNEPICLRNDADLAVALRNLHRVAGKDVLCVRLPQSAAALGKAASAVGSSANRMRSSSPTVAISGVSTGPETPALSEYVPAIVCKEEVSDDIVQEAIGTAPVAEIGSSADFPEAGGFIDLARGVEPVALVAHVKLEPKVEPLDCVQQEEGSLDTAYLSDTAATNALSNGTASRPAAGRRGLKSPSTQEKESEPEEQNAVVEAEATPNNCRINAASNNAKRKRPNTPPPEPASTISCMSYLTTNQAGKHRQEILKLSGESLPTTVHRRLCLLSQDVKLAITQNPHLSRLQFSQKIIGNLNQRHANFRNNHKRAQGEQSSVFGAFSSAVREVKPTTTFFVAMTTYPSGQNVAPSARSVKKTISYRTNIVIFKRRQDSGFDTYLYEPFLRDRTEVPTIDYVKSQTLRQAVKGRESKGKLLLAVRRVYYSWGSTPYDDGISTGQQLALRFLNEFLAAEPNNFLESNFQLLWERGNKKFTSR